MTWEIKRKHPTFKRRNVGHPENLIVLNVSQRGEIRKADPSACGLGMTPRTRKKKPQVARAFFERESYASAGRRDDLNCKRSAAYAKMALAGGGDRGADGNWREPVVAVGFRAG